jgi:chorismate synthase
MSTFGQYFRVNTFGESHCRGVGCVIDGVPPRMTLCAADIQCALDRRRPGQSALTTARAETDRVQIISGVERQRTLGTPIALLVHNEDQRPAEYEFHCVAFWPRCLFLFQRLILFLSLSYDAMADIPRPSHGDFTYQQKYGVRASSGGGRSSARETVGRVAAGAVAEKFLREQFGIDIIAWVSAVGPLQLSRDFETNHALTRTDVDRHPTRCPDAKLADEMSTMIRSFFFFFFFFDFVIVFSQHFSIHQITSLCHDLQNRYAMKKILSAVL